MKERRQLSRWDVALPCRVTWRDHRLQGQIANISYGGALIVRADRIPPVEAIITLDVETDQGSCCLEARVTARLIHSTWEILSSGWAGSFGVQFLEPPDQIQAKLAILLPFPLTQ